MHWVIYYFYDYKVVQKFFLQKENADLFLEKLKKEEQEKKANYYANIQQIKFEDE